MTPQEKELRAALPEPFRVYQFRRDHDRMPEYAPLMNRPMVPLYTAEQMRAYAEAASSALLAEVGVAYEAGWRTAAEWANREDLYADIGSPRYLHDKKIAIDAVVKEMMVDRAAAAIGKGG